MLETIYNDLKEEMSVKEILAVLLIGGSIGAFVMGLLIIDK